MKVELAIDSYDELGEGPVWDPIQERLYWVDILGPALQQWDPKTGRRARWAMPTDIGSYALRESGGFVVALRNGLAFFDPKSQTFSPITNPEAHLPDTRFNDGKCDRLGRFWAGTMDESGQQQGGLYRLNEAQECRKMRSNIGISNGLGWSPDNRTFYYTDSTQHTIFAYDFDSELGTLSNAHIFAQTPPEYVPDGLTVDAAGFVWSANWDGWKITRYAPDGTIDREIKMPIQRPTSCIFGGENLTDLYVTSAKIGLAAEALATQPLAGCVFVIQTNVQGLPEPQFAG